MIVVEALTLLGGIMILGFIGNYIFNRTQIPSIVWLLLFGLIIGYIINIRGQIGLDLLKTGSEFFAAIAIVIILFDGGINTDLHKLFKGAPRGLLLTISGFCLSLIATIIIIVGLTAAGVLPLTMEQGFSFGLLLGAIIGGTSSPIVIPLAQRLKNLQEKTKTILSIESILTDPLSIVIFLAIFYMISSGGGISDGIKSVISTFSVGGVLGAIIGLLWLPIMHKIRKMQFSYIATLAIVFLLYSLTESLWTGSGVLACLIFGLVLGNGKKVLRIIKYEGKTFEMDQETKNYHSLISFVIRTFFFVFLGIIVSYNDVGVAFILIGIIILITILALRYLAVQITTIKGGFEKDDKQTINMMLPRGLAAAILAIRYGPEIIDIYRPYLINPVVLTGFFEGVSFVVILGTAIITTIGVSIICHCEMKKTKNIEKTS